jgi:3-amino-5-hydroxybenzoic acid synthesis related protein
VSAAGPRGASPVILLFDLDGTLIDSEALVVSASAEALRQGAGLRVPVEEIRQTLALTVTDRFHRFFSGPVQPLVDLYIKIYGAGVATAPPFPGVPEMLAALRARGVRSAVVTSKRRPTTDLTLRTHGLTGYFEAVVCEEDIARPKPAPDPVLEAARTLRVPPGETVMIGDSTLDMQSGRAAGGRTGAALWGTVERAALLAFRPDFAFDAPADVVDLAAEPA